MLKTDAVIKLLKQNKEPMSFDDIWTNVKEDTMSTINKEQEENVVKSDMYISMMEEQQLLMIGENKWTIKENYSFEEVHNIEKTRMTEELELEIGLEKSDDTRELKLEILADNGED